MVNKGLWSVLMRCEKNGLVHHGYDREKTNEFMAHGLGKSIIRRRMQVSLLVSLRQRG